MPALNRRKLAAAAFGLALAAAFALPFLRPAPPAPRYTVTDLGVLPGGTESYAHGLNTQGVVCGSTLIGINECACIFQNGKVTPLSVPPGVTSSAAVSINAWGEVVGRSTLPSAMPQAFLYSGGKLRSLGTLPGFGGSLGNAINDRGEVAGTQVNYAARPGASSEHAFFYSHGKMTDMGTLPGAYESNAYCLNSVGQVAGDCHFHFRGGGFPIVPFLYDSRRKTMTALPTPISCIYGRARAYAINDHGVVAGIINDGTAGHAALWSGGHLTDLGAPGGYDNAEAEGLNNQGNIVGQCYRELSAFQAFLHRNAGHNNPWQRYVDRDTSQGAFLYKDGRMQDLNALIPADAGWRLEEAHSINDRGQIAGTGLHNGQRRAFLLTPR